MNKKCAYCGKELPLTREHIWPSCLIKKSEQQLFTYNGRVDKFYQSEPQICDVCQNCNNNKLSIVDKYLCSLYDNQFDNIINPGEPANLHYQYDLLLRGLLKISYNAARSFNKNEDTVQLHKNFSKYILGEQRIRPKTVRLQLQIVTASKIIVPDSNELKMWEPSHLRCGGINYDGKLSNKIIIRMVAIRCYYFYIMISKHPITSSKYRGFLKELGNWRTPLGVYVDPSSSSLHIPVNKTTYLHPQLLENMATAAIKFFK